MQPGSLPEANDPMGASPAPPAFAPDPRSGENAKTRGPIRISEGVMAGLTQTRVNPVYPPEARSAGVQGVVTLAVLVTKTGTVQNISLLSGPPALAEAARAAVQQWTYRPFLLNGQPVDVQTTVHVDFNLAASQASGPQTR